MNNSLPQNKLLLIVSFILVLVFGVIYLVFIRFQTTDVIKDGVENTVNITPTGSSAYFIPPKSEFVEATVTGRIVKLSDSEAINTKASHKIVVNGETVTLAIAEDDKLKQQEGSTVTVVGDIPVNQTLSDKSVLKVKYILFK